MRPSRRTFLAAGLFFAREVSAAPGPSFPAAPFLTYDQAAAYLKSCRPALPAALAGLTENGLRQRWPEWIQSEDQAIRARLLRGEEDSLVNFVLFGVSFTREPRIVPGDSASEEAARRLFQARVQDFVAGVQKPGSNERLLWLREVLTRRGYGTGTPEGRQRLTRYVLENIARYFSEQDKFRGTLDRDLNSSDRESAFGARSQLYRERGLSVDTDFRPDYAVERTLAELKRRGRLARVRRVAIIGPGLDFTDKNNGFDFYPLQTLQPFAVIDSVLRLGLARKQDLHVTVFDISSQTLDHIGRAVRRAQSGQPYFIDLLLDQTRPWNPDAVEYWRKFGAEIGVPADPVTVPAGVSNVETRALRIPPGIVKTLEPISLNIVSQHLDRSPAEAYDLIVATNIFIYYDAFQHGLSLLNLNAMLAPNGLFLSNDLLEECAGVTPRRIESVSVTYSERPNDGDRIEVYARPDARFR